MLPKRLFKKNIINKEDLQLAFKEVSESIYTEHFRFLIVDNNKYDYPSIGVITAKKNIRLAAKRNLCRRILKEAFRVNMHLFKNMMIIVIVKKNAANANKRELWLSVDTLLKNLVK